MKQLLAFVFFFGGTVGTVTGQSNPISTGTVKSILFIDSSAQFETIEDVLALPRFRNKLVYIDVWGTTCVPCLKQFAISNPAHRVLKRKNVEFLYICYDTQANTNLEHRKKWKEIVNKFKLEGTHIYAYVLPPDKLVHEKVDMAFLTKHSSGSIAFAIPMYMLAKEGKIIKYYARQPGDRELLFNQVDSVRNITIDK